MKRYNLIALLLFVVGSFGIGSVFAQEKTPAGENTSKQIKTEKDLGDCIVEAGARDVDFSVQPNGAWRFDFKNRSEGTISVRERILQCMRSKGYRANN